MPECEECGGHVSKKFDRVVGPDDVTICIECLPTGFGLNRESTWADL